MNNLKFLILKEINTLFIIQKYINILLRKKKDYD